MTRDQRLAWVLACHLVRTAAATTDQPVALALSHSAAHHTRHSLHPATVTWRRAGQVTRVLAWQAGDIGPLAVAVGAVGYETGLCAREQHPRRPGPPP